MLELGFPVAQKEYNCPKWTIIKGLAFYMHRLLSVSLKCIWIDLKCFSDV